MAELKLESDGAETKPVRTNVDFVRHVENTLGVILDPSKPPWKARQIEAGKLKRKRETNKKLYTIDNLLLTVEWLRQRRQHVKSAAAVCWHVERALKEAPEPELAPDEFEQRYAYAIRVEQHLGETEWLGRLLRARGDARKELLSEWEAAQGVRD